MLGCDLGGDASSDEVCAAMDWLVARQGMIESFLARRHLPEGSMVLNDLLSSWMEGTHCPLAARGYFRDKKSGKTQIEHGLMTDAEGRPISIEVFAGNTADPMAFVSAVETVRKWFKFREVVMVGRPWHDHLGAHRGTVRGFGGISWVTCLRAPAIKALAEQEAIQLSLFDETNLAEITHPDYSGERLVACRNPALVAERARKRAELLAATEVELDKIAAAVSRERRALRGEDRIALRVGRVANRYKMAKHFEIAISEDTFSFSRRQGAIDAEASLDGIYVIRTNVAPERFDVAGAVTTYEGLAVVERDLRNMKAIDLDLRPISHFTEDRVRSHVFICMLAAYLPWHLRRAVAPLCFTGSSAPRSRPGSDLRRQNDGRDQ